MRKKLSITQIVLLVIAAILPMLDGMFTWITYTLSDNIGKTEMSLYNLMTVQQIGGGPIIYWLFYVALAVTVVYCVVQLFYENNLTRSKATIALPAITLVLNAIMIIAANAHRDSFEYYGERRYVGVELGVLAYIELILLAAAVVVECYKQIKCVEQKD